jgi:hypothetical protein
MARIQEKLAFSISSGAVSEDCTCSPLIGKVWDKERAENPKTRDSQSLLRAETFEFRTLVEQELGRDILSYVVELP